MNQYPVITAAEGVERAFTTLFEEADYVRPAELHHHQELSARFSANIFLLSELHQVSGAYKIRGAYNWFANNQSQDVNEVVAFSAGNHAAAVAACANLFEVKAKIFLPENTPAYKLELVKKLGGTSVTPVLAGNDVDEAAAVGFNYLRHSGNSTKFIHPFDDPLVVAGQGTLGIELEQALDDVDVIVAPVGGGGLLSGLIQATSYRPGLHYVAVEPKNAPSLSHNLTNPDESLPSIDTFVDGAAVKKVGKTVLETLATIPDRFSLVHADNATLRRHVTELWTARDGFRPELAGALSVAALEDIQTGILGKTVVCIVSGGNLSEKRFQEKVRI